MEVVKNVQYRCGECGRLYVRKDLALQCEIYDRDNRVKQEYHKNRMEVVETIDGTILYYAESLDLLDEYLDMFFSFDIDSCDYENEEFPCYMVIRQYDENILYENCTQSYGSIISFDKLVKTINRSKNSLEYRLFGMGDDVGE